MDRVPPKLPNTSSRLIAMAVSLVGSAARVMGEMKCSAHHFRQYCEGRTEPTLPEFERLVTLIVREQGKMIARNREMVAAIRKQVRKD